MAEPTSWEGDDRPVPEYDQMSEIESLTTRLVEMRRERDTLIKCCEDLTPYLRLGSGVSYSTIDVFMGVCEALGKMYRAIDAIRARGD